MKNKIISISGQPVTGKSTTVNGLTDKLIEKGYDKEKIHHISTGEKFREYSNIMVEIINSSEDPNKSKNLYNNEKISRLMKDRDVRGAFIKSLVEIKDAKIDLSNFTIEHANNLKEFGAIREVLDKLVDNEMKNLGAEINQEERPDEIWIIDSRLAFHNIPDSFSVRLTAEPEVAGQRLLDDDKRGIEDSEYNSVEEAIKTREARRIGEQERYMERYGVDLEDEKNYDLIIDTSYSNVDDIADTILTCLDKYDKNEYFTKNWTSPKTMLPLQNIMETIYGFEEIEKSIKEKGFLPEKGIDVVEVEGYKFIIEGHHRNFAAAYAGKTLVPYEVIGKDDDKICYGGATARQRVGYLSLPTVYDHEGFISRDFRYTQIYPDVYDFIKEQNEKIREGYSRKEEEPER